MVRSNNSLQVDEEEDALAEALQEDDDEELVRSFLLSFVCSFCCLSVCSCFFVFPRSLVHLLVLRSCVSFIV